MRRWFAIRVRAFAVWEAAAPGRSGLRAFLRNDAVSVPAMVEHATTAVSARAVGRDVVVVQDTSELVLGGRRARSQGYGPVGKGGALGGVLLHAGLALDADDGGLLGLVDAQVWNRDHGMVAPRRARSLGDKESQRWLSTTERAGTVLASARRITVVSDRESDIYAYFARRPTNTHLIIRACQNRKITPDKITPDKITSQGREGALLFAHVDTLPEAGRLHTTIPAAPGRRQREAELALRFGPVDLCRPRNGLTSELPHTVGLMAVDVREVSSSGDAEPIHWRLLTTHGVSNLDQARRIVELYRMRWTIEDFFRTLKTAGFDIEEADIGDPRAMMNFVAAATIAAVTVLQLVKAREGTTDQKLADAFEPGDQPVLEALCARLEGATARQKNPHPKGSLAFAAWVIAKLGGWTGYYGKPGPKVMRIGLQDFRHIKYGTLLIPKQDM